VVTAVEWEIFNLLWFLMRSLLTGKIRFLSPGAIGDYGVASVEGTAYLVFLFFKRSNIFKLFHFP
jgi:hypothetical protein